ncbi:SDR family NAD(P)-dependent oxidoreductase [Rhodoferax sp.]|uniref:SDR family NAD(P)-dependent oxidoreductase n=1 Tax=Rhodoferax sp. TaxID=50421 RepID=UPI0008CB398C|nr:SDR family NAD(P)-dependent oxidoreductase [Rhodoferax sp.]MDO8321233.1 SDR family NAD(P)-dependent oxidoreductase [Rhodoferax sp.]MDP2678920.1 SDR family NAD(P)-dependent oxidoreductase [Rhodoferax sp.]OGB59824.1 MAG: short-chain dehydrogenase [Burkholderiales bacterium RIFOXYD12_FULL_59_19]OGB76754.1 MAG: short-chain dehydrogenase [Burkholderiales bacterium RIFOXYC12_FULL_60_6]
MQRHLFILTGASRGMGRAMAEQLLAKENHVLCISRHPESSLVSVAEQNHGILEQWALDLSQSEHAARRLKTWLDLLDPAQIKSVTLINNAGVIPTITPVSASEPAEFAAAMRINLETPMLLTAVFLHATQGWTVPRKVLNISSGLGRRPMASQAAYCAAKAGLDHFTRCLALDEARLPQGARVCSLAPGVIDTDMQLQLRSANAASFPDQAGFAQLKSAGQLSAASDAAKRVLAWLARPDFGQQVIADVRDHT